MENTKPTYAEAIGEIEAILARFDRDELDVDTLAAQVRRATQLIALCRTRLRTAEDDVARVLTDNK